MSTESGSSPMKKVIDPAAIRTQFFLLQREPRKNAQGDCEKSWLEGHLQMLQKLINMLEEDEANGSFLLVSENYLRHLKEEYAKYDEKLKDHKSSIDSDYQKRNRQPVRRHRPPENSESLQEGYHTLSSYISSEVDSDDKAKAHRSRRVQRRLAKRSKQDASN